MTLKETVNQIKLTSGCKDCGYCKHAEALHFDHLPQFTKLGDVSEYVYRGLRKMALTEIAKCEVVCANCHAIRTSTRRQQSVKSARPFRTVNEDNTIIAVLWPDLACGLLPEI